MTDSGRRENSARPTVLTVKNLVKTREKGGVRFELRIPSLEVAAGEFLAVVGASGCGKSTLLDMLGLVLKPDSADIFALTPCLKNRTGDRTDLLNKSERVLSRLRRREIGYVLQSGGLLPYLTVRENILLPCLLNRHPAGQAEEEAERLARQLGIIDHMSKKPAHLSGGQRQRVAIARAMAHAPCQVLADEPTAAVDHLTALEIRDAFRALANEQGVALIMVTHDRNLIKGCADRHVTFDVRKIASGHTLSTLVEGD
jgi:putative ABC transport system ATP-binding protein